MTTTNGTEPHEDETYGEAVKRFRGHRSQASVGRAVGKPGGSAIGRIESPNDDYRGSESVLNRIIKVLNLDESDAAYLRRLWVAEDPAMPARRADVAALRSYVDDGLADLLARLTGLAHRLEQVEARNPERHRGGSGSRPPAAGDG